MSAGRESSGRAGAVRRAGVCALLLVATLGEGGASPEGILAVHAGVTLLVVAALALPASRGPARAPLAAFLAFVAATAVGAAFAPYPYAALLVLLEAAAFLAAVWLASREGTRLVVPLAWTLLAGAAAQGLLACYQRVLGEVRPAGTFLNTNHLAAWIVAALFVALAAGGGRSAARGWPLRVALAAPALAALVMTGSRGALAGSAVAAVWWTWSVWSEKGGRFRASAAAIATLVIALLAVGVVLRQQKPDPFAYHRLRIWRASLEAVAASPWTGTGPGQFAPAARNLNFPVEQGPLRYERHFTTTHSDLLRLPCEFGLPAAASLLLAIVLVARGVGGRSGRGDLPATSAGAVAALVALGVQSCVDDLSRRPAVYLLTGVLIGCLLSERGRPRLRSPAFRAVAAGLVAIVFLVADGGPFLAWRATRGGAGEERLPRGRLTEAQLSRLHDAQRLNPLHPDHWLREAEHLTATDGAWTIEAYAGAREAAERAIRLQPADSLYRRGLARVEARGCLELFRDEASRERAARAYASAEALARYDPFLSLESAEFLLAAGDPDRARRAAERALRIEPRAVAPRLLLSEIFLAAGATAEGRHAAARHLSAAEAAAARWADHPRQTGYARRLLRLDGARVRAVRAALGRPVPAGA